MIRRGGAATSLPSACSGQHKQLQMCTNKRQLHRTTDSIGIVLVRSLRHTGLITEAHNPSFWRSTRSSVSEEQLMDPSMSVYLPCAFFATIGPEVPLLEFIVAQQLNPSGPTFLQQ
jgi:hypothetical protein